MYSFKNYKKSAHEPIEMVYGWMQDFTKELNRYSAIFSHEPIWRRYSERPLVGLMIQGMCRNNLEDGRLILQEFGVYDRIGLNERFIGRCDMFVRQSCNDILVEAKYFTSYGGTNHWDDSKFNEWIETKIYNQCKTYFDAESDEYFCNGKNEVYLVGLVFNQVVKSSIQGCDDHMEAGLKYRLPSDNCFYGQIVFDYEKCNHSQKHYSLLEVYGKIWKIEPSFKH